MKKLMVFVLVSVITLSMVGCANKKYELPHDQCCYSADGSQIYELNNGDMQYVIDILNNASWVNDLGNCCSEFVFYTQKQEVRYHSVCGTFNDYTNKRCTTISEEQRATINKMLGIN